MDASEVRWQATAAVDANAFRSQNGAQSVGLAVEDALVFVCHFLRAVVFLGVEAELLALVARLEIIVVAAASAEGELLAAFALRIEVKALEGRVTQATVDCLRTDLLALFDVLLRFRCLFDKGQSG